MSNIIGFNDLDNDGCEDYISFSEDSSDYNIIWGDSNLIQVEKKAYTSASTYRMNMQIANLDNVGNSELVKVTREDNSNFDVLIIEIYTFTSDRNLDLLQTISFNVEFLPTNGDLSIIDIDGDGFKELFFERHRGKVRIFIKDTSDTFLYKPDYIEFSDLDLIPIGDLDNDGRYDFYFFDEYMAMGRIAFGSENYKFSLGDYIFPQGWTREVVRYNRYGGFGDMDGDGIDDLLMSVSSPEIFGRRLIYGNLSRLFTGTHVMYIYRDLDSEIISTATVGDINGDNIDDFSIILETLNEVWVFWGGDVLAKTPDLVLKTEKGVTSPNYAVGGDFNDDGFRDIAVNFRNGVPRIEMYFGGENIDGVPDFTMLQPSLPGCIIPATGGVFALSNAGDINNV